MFKKLDGYTDALTTAVSLDAFTEEVLTHNEEYTRGIVELIAYTFIDTDDQVDLGSDYIRNAIIEEGQKLSSM